MDIPQGTIEQYLPTVEEFLTSLLLEETDISVSNYELVNKDSALDQPKDSDIFLYARETNTNAGITVVLDEEWFGLLSSIMLGIEEKEKNEQTIGLLKEFAADLSDVLINKAQEEEVELAFDDVEVFSKEEMQEALSYEEYQWGKLEILGIADEAVRAEFLIGDPATEIEQEEPEEEVAEEAEEEKSSGFNEISSLEDEDDEELGAVKSEAKSKEGKTQEVVSARQIEFAEFSEEGTDVNGGTHRMDLLKDVELDVSVELGRIELPLGKVLELAKGSVIELEKLAGEPVDVLVNGNRIALGEVVVIDEHFGVRISSLVTTKKRLAKLKNGS